MSSAAISTPKTSNAPSSSTLWFHLLWKDFRQVRMLIVGVAIVEACLQLMMGLLESLFPSEMGLISLNAINIALATPTLLAIGCSGVLIGQERQTGCWTWSSSLPVSWRQSIASKTLVWFGASLVSTLLLLAVAAIALAMNHRSLSIELFPSPISSDGARWTQLMTLIIGVQVFVILSIATLLIKDTLMAIVIAACVVFAFQLGLAFLNESYQRRIESWILLAESASIIVGWIGLVATYRWRWGTGQYTQATNIRSIGLGSATSTRALQRALSRPMAQPSELRMLFQHGLRSSLGLRLTVLLSAMFTIFISTGIPWVPGPFTAFLASCILGVSVFSGEQTLNRYRFFADRGVSWKRLLASHVAPPALMTIVLVVFGTMSVPWPSFINWPRELPQFYAACGAAFVVGMFSSLVFSSPIISITATFAMMLGALFFCLFASSMWNSIAPGYWNAIVIWAPVSILLVLIVAVRQVPGWLIKDRFKATWVYFGSIFIASLLPGVLGISLGFLQIPNIPWEGAPIEQIKAVDWTGGPDLTAWSGAVSFDPSDLADNVPAATTAADNLSILSPEWPLAQDPSWTASPAKLLRAIEDGGEKPGKFDYATASNLESMIKSSAALALVATQSRQKEEAIRLWKANRKLIAFCQQPALQVATLRSVVNVWVIWIAMLKDDELRFLAESNELSDLVPPSISPDQIREVLRARATLRRPYGRNDDIRQYYCADVFWDGSTPLEIYPPIRWAYQRQSALALREDLRNIKDLRNIGTNNWAFNRTFYSDRLTEQYSLVLMYEKSLQQRLARLQASTTEPETQSSLQDPTTSPLFQSPSQE